jgi:phenylalanyl-tRNA synthetase beta chain
VPQARDAAPGEAAGTYSVTLPSWRLDLEREIDLIEEVARVYGYDRFANTLPAFSGTVLELPHAAHASAMRSRMLALGFHEALTGTFCSPAEAELFAPQPGLAVAMGNPLNAEASVLRPSPLAGLLGAVEANLNRNVEEIRLFEMGTTFSGSTERVEERPALAFAATGRDPASGPHRAARPFDFYDAKGAVETLVASFQYRQSYFDAPRIASAPGSSEPKSLLPAWLHPGRAARCVVDGATVGYFGQLHPEEARRRKLRQEVYVGEFYLDRLYQLPLRQPRAQELSRFQPVARDFSIVFPDAVAWESIAAEIQTLDIAELLSFTPREVFRPSKADGHYSLLLSVVFQSPDSTLRDEEVQQWSRRIVDSLESIGGKLRR